MYFIIFLKITFNQLLQSKQILHCCFSLSSLETTEFKKMLRYIFSSIDQIRSETYNSVHTKLLIYFSSNWISHHV